MKKKILAVFFTICMLTGIVACGGSDTAEISAEKEVKEEVLAEEETETAENPAEEENAEELITVGFAYSEAESVWKTASTESVRTTFTEENGFELLIEDARQKQENQIMAVRNFIDQEVDYILLSPVISTGWDIILTEAKEAGIPVILIDSHIETSDDSLYAAYVGDDYLAEGRKAGEWMGKWLEAKEIESTNIVNIQSTEGSYVQIGRSRGLTEACEKYDSMNLLAEQSGDFNQDKAQKVMETYLEQYEDINIVYCENDNMALGAIEAIEAAGKIAGSDIANGEIMVVTFDGIKAGMQLGYEEKISLVVESNPFHGPRAMELVKAMAADEEVEKIAYVEGGIFSKDLTVPSIEVDGITYEITEITRELVDARIY